MEVNRLAGGDMSNKEPELSRWDSYESSLVLKSRAELCD